MNKGMTIVCTKRTYLITNQTGLSFEVECDKPLYDVEKLLEHDTDVASFFKNVKITNFRLPVRNLPVRNNGEDSERTLDQQDRHVPKRQRLSIILNTFRDRKFTREDIKDHIPNATDITAYSDIADLIKHNRITEVGIRDGIKEYEITEKNEDQRIDGVKRVLEDKKTLEATILEKPPL